MKTKIAALVLSVLLVLTGCSYNQTGIDALLTPPKLSKEQNNIYNALVSSVGKNITLSYPRKGEYTSAFLLYNMDSDPENEAIVFYSPNSAAGASSIRINVLDRDANGKWVSAYDASGMSNASDIETVSFVKESGSTYMIVGFNLSDALEKNVVVYQFTEGKLEETTRLNCSNYQVCDLNQDQVSELITITPKVYINGTQTVLAELRRITSNGSTRILGTAPLDPDVDEYSAITAGRLSDGRTALYLDGVRGADVYTTEILACNKDGQIDNLIYNPDKDKNLVDQTERNYGLPSVDINHDHILEIPVRVLAPGYQDTEANQQEVFTKWYIYQKGELKLKKTTYVAYSLGYIFSLPEDWVGKVTVSYDSSGNELTFYEYHAGKPLDRKLMSIKVLKRSDYEKAVQWQGYSLLLDNGQSIYTYQIYEYGTNLKITPEEIMNNFQLYNS